MTADDSVPRLLGNRVVRYADSSGAPLSVARVAHREGPVLVLIVQAAGEVAEALDRITIDARSRPRISDVARCCAGTTPRGRWISCWSTTCSC
jgi:hypothetical protein